MNTSTSPASVSFSGYQKVVVAMLAFLQFAVILDFMLMSPLGAVIMPALSITPAQFGTVVSAYAFAAGISGLLTAGFADRFDRKKLNEGQQGKGRGHRNQRQGPGWKTLQSSGDRHDAVSSITLDVDAARLEQGAQIVGSDQMAAADGDEGNARALQPLFKLVGPVLVAVLEQAVEPRL